MSRMAQILLLPAGAFSMARCNYQTSWGFGASHAGRLMLFRVAELAIAPASPSSSCYLVLQLAPLMTTSQACVACDFSPSHRYFDCAAPAWAGCWRYDATVC